LPVASRGCAFGDFDNDGTSTCGEHGERLSAVLLRAIPRMGTIDQVRTIGTKSNRSGIGARLRCRHASSDEAKPHQQSTSGSGGS